MSNEIEENGYAMLEYTEMMVLQEILESNNNGYMPTTQDVANKLNIGFETARNAMCRLVEIGIMEDMTGAAIH